MYWIHNCFDYIKDNLVIPSAFPKVNYERKITDEITLFKRFEIETDNVSTEYWMYGATKYIDVHNVNMFFPITHNFDSRTIDLYIAFHANGETCLDMADYFHEYIAETKYRGLWVFIEFPGYGFNPRNSKIFISDFKKVIMTVYDKMRSLINEGNLSLRSTTILGRSIGTAFAIWLSTKIKNNRLLLIHPFTSILEVALGQPQRTFYKQGRFLEMVNILDNFCTIKKTRSKDILILHAFDDKTIHFSHSKVLYNILRYNHDIKKYNVTLWLLPTGGHTTEFVHKTYYKSNTYKNIVTKSTIPSNEPKNAIFYKHKNGHMEISLYKDILFFITGRSFQ